MKHHMIIILSLMVLAGCSSGTVIDTVPDNKQPVFGIMSDADGNTYKTVWIVDQVWMAENLKTTKYNDMTSIPQVADTKSWLALTSPGYCWHDNLIVNKNTHGAYYNWYTVSTGKLCPTGWRVPTDADWSLLSSNMGVDAGIALKSHGTPDWISPGAQITDASGFCALATGYRNYSGDFTTGADSNWWSAEVAKIDPNYGVYRYVYYSNNKLNANGLLKYAGLSVRCLKN